MKSKRKLLVSMLVIVFVLLAMVATIAIVFALSQQTITTTLNISYVVEDIDGTASASYTVGGVTEKLTAMKDNQVIGNTLVFHAGDTEDAGNLMFPEDKLPLSAQNDNVVIQYTYSNTGGKHYIASMNLNANIVAENMKVEYSINGIDYSEQCYAVVVPANTSNKSYWIKISIKDKAKAASFTGDFNWLLSGCDPQDEDYLSLTSLEFTGSNGSYSASVASTGSYVGELVFPSSVNGDPVTTIAANYNLTQEQKNQVTSVYIPDSVTTIGDSAFWYYQNIQTVTFEQNETGGASAQSGTGLKTIGVEAFLDCPGLTSITIPNSVTSIGDRAFLGCTGLTSIELPASLTTLGVMALQSCTSLTSIEIPAGLTSIGWGAFSYCTRLTSIAIPNSVTSIGLRPFNCCEDLTSITVASGNTKYHSAGNCLIETASKALLSGCKTSVIPTDGSVTKIEDGAFFGVGLTHIWVPINIVNVPDNGPPAFGVAAEGSITVYCEAESRPSSWNIGISEGCGAIFKYGYTYEEYLAEVNS